MSPSKPRRWGSLLIVAVFLAGAAVLLITPRLMPRRTAVPLAAMEAQQPPKPIDITGRVVDEAGRPVANIAVALYTRDTAFRPREEAEKRVAGTHTDRHGAFRFARVPVVDRMQAFQVLCARSPGSVACDTLTPSYNHALKLRLPRAALLRGMVTDTSGKPIWGATVRPHALRYSSLPEPWARAHEVRTERFGQYAIPCGAGLLADLFVRAPGYADQRLRFTVPQQGAANAPVVRLPFGSVLTGVVRYEGTGQPAAGVHLACRGNGAVTDARGRYRVAGLGVGACTTIVRDSAIEEDWTAAAQTVRIWPEGGSARADLTLTRGAVVRARVLDADLGVPVPKAGVGCYCGDRSRMEHLVIAETGADGVAILRVPPGPVHVYVMGPCPGYLRPESTGAPRPTMVATPGGSNEVTFRLRAGAEIIGQVTDAAGKPVTGARVWVSHASAWSHSGADRDAPTSFSGPDGRYRLSGVEPGRVWLTAESETASVLQPVVVGARDDRAVSAELRLDAPLAGPITGRIVSPSGAPLGGARVQIDVNLRGNPPNASNRMAFETDASGRFSFDRVFQGRSYTVIAFPSRGGRGFVAQTVTATASKTDLGDLVMRW